MTAAEREVELTRGNLEAVERQAAASSGQLALAQEAFEASVIPILAEVPESSPEPAEEARYPGSGYRQTFLPAQVEVSDWNGSQHISIALRNVGNGIAVITSLGLTSGGFAEGAFTRKIVPVGEIVRFAFATPFDHPDAGPVLTSLKAGTITIVVGYDDATGRQHLIEHADLHQNDLGLWRIRQLSVYRRGEPEPFLRSGPSDA